MASTNTTDERLSKNIIDGSTKLQLELRRLDEQREKTAYWAKKITEAEFLKANPYFNGPLLDPRDRGRAPDDILSDAREYYSESANKEMAMKANFDAKIQKLVQEQRNVPLSILPDAPEVATQPKTRSIWDPLVKAFILDYESRPSSAASDRSSSAELVRLAAEERMKQRTNRVEILPSRLNVSRGINTDPDTETDDLRRRLAEQEQLRRTAEERLAVRPRMRDAQTSPSPPPIPSWAMKRSNSPINSGPFATPLSTSRFDYPAEEQNTVAYRLSRVPSPPVRPFFRAPSEALSSPPSQVPPRFKRPPPSPLSSAPPPVLPLPTPPRFRRPPSPPPPPSVYIPPSPRPRSGSSTRGLPNEASVPRRSPSRLNPLERPNSEPLPPRPFPPPGRQPFLPPGRRPASPPGRRPPFPPPGRRPESPPGRRPASPPGRRPPFPPPGRPLSELPLENGSEPSESILGPKTFPYPGLIYPTPNGGVKNVDHQITSSRRRRRRRSYPFILPGYPLRRPSYRKKLATRRRCRNALGRFVRCQ